MSLFVLVWFTLLMMPRPWADQVLAENGPIEIPSAVGYLVAASFVWILHKPRRWFTEIPATVLLIAACLRELDFQVRFTSSYAFSAGFFLHSQASFLEKSIVAFVLLTLAICAGLLIMFNGGRFIRMLLRRFDWAVTMASAFALLVIPTTLDEAGGFMRRHYATSTSELQFVMWMVEETFEAAAPILFSLSAVRPTYAAAAPERKAA